MQSLCWQRPGESVSSPAKGLILVRSSTYSSSWLQTGARYEINSFHSSFVWLNGLRSPERQNNTHYCQFSPRLFSVSQQRRISHCSIRWRHLIKVCLWRNTSSRCSQSVRTALKLQTSPSGQQGQRSAKRSARWCPSRSSTAYKWVKWWKQSDASWVETFSRVPFLICFQVVKSPISFSEQEWSADVWMSSSHASLQIRAPPPNH